MKTQADLAAASLSVLQAAQEEPAQVALRVDGRSYSFAELAPLVAQKCAQLQGLLGQRPAGAWLRVALLGTPRLETVLTLYALFELGATAVLLHPRLTVAEHARLCADAQPTLCLDGLPAMSSVVSGGLRLPTEPPLAMLFTSGTSGRPKGALLSRRAFIAAAEASAQNLGWQPEDRWLLCMPLAHVGGLSILVRCLVARRTMVLPPERPSGSFDAATIAQLVERERVTLLSVVPTMLSRLLALQPQWQPPSSLRAVLLGGAAASPALLSEAAQRRIPALTTYGLTEACSQVTTQRYGSVPDAAQGAGEPIAGLELRIVDDQIQVRGPTLFDGYFPLDTHPSALLADGFFATGDLGRLDEAGRLHVLARRTDLIVSGGENIYPTEVEQALEQVPGIAAACVFGLPDAQWGQSVAAALVATAEPLSLVNVRQALSSLLAGYKHPRRLVWLAALPQNATGKLDRGAAAAQALRVIGADEQ
jgi:O-succinylbenzoic acid--CoA ligase